MAKINILDANTIDKIAAGEVVERPMSVVKELVENAIDAGATIVTVEIKGGGTKLIRVTDNGSGIDSDQIRNAFYPHATSKIIDAEDLNHLSTLGFRGEALSSIAAVSRTEVTTRTPDAFTGVHYIVEGGKEECFEEVGAPAGTTFIVRDLFYNTLPRLKFLKSESSEGGLIADLMEHLALSMPHISFNFINNGNTKFSTSGRGDLKEVIYRLFGRETATHIREFSFEAPNLSMQVNGFLGLPAINRANRAGEIFFINHRYVKSSLISKAVEEGYVEYLMQHKFPFCVINMEFDPYTIDVNVHPTKTEVRISSEKEVYAELVRGISECLSAREMIDNCIFDEREAPTSKPVIRLPEAFEQKRIQESLGDVGVNASPVSDMTDNRLEVPVETDTKEISTLVESDIDDFFVDNTDRISDKLPSADSKITQVNSVVVPEMASPVFEEKIRDYEQLQFMDNDRLLSVEARRKYRVIGQLFKTYWLIEYENSLLILDQHAAHEKVRFERLLKFIQEKKDVPSQLISPPDVVTLSNREKQILFENIDRFKELGFELEEFGEHEIAIRSIPLDLYGSSPREMVNEIISDLVSLKKSDTPDTIRNRIATMACKSAIKGNNTVSQAEIELLLDEMLTLDNPYNCPHGRPTIITMSEQELEKRFHRIV